MSPLGEPPASRERRLLRFRPGNRRARVVGMYQSDAAEVENTGPQAWSRVTLYAATALIAVFLCWASLSDVDEVIRGGGRVVGTDPNVVLGPLETSVVRSIDAHVGDLVRAGEPLAHLDPTFSEADESELVRRKASLDAQIARLSAELAGREYHVSIDAGPDDQLQATLAAARHAQYVAQYQSLEQRAAQNAAQIVTRQRQVELLRQRQVGLLQQEAMRLQLESQGNGSKLQRLQTQDARLEVDAGLAQASSEIVEYTHQLESARADLEAFAQKWRQDASQELVAARKDEATAAEQLSKATRRHDMIVLTTPRDAVVLEVAPVSVGTVVREAQTLFTLVPVDKPAEVEMEIAAADIGRIAAGAPVQIKLEAFPYQENGTLGGVVKVISADAFLPQHGSSDATHAAAEALNAESAGGDHNLAGGKPFYKVRVALDGTRLRNVPDSFRLIPGMTATGEIKVGKRRLISYLLYPLRRGLDESFREP